MNVLIQVKDAAGEVLYSGEGNGRVSLVFDRVYCDGDTICITTAPGSFLKVFVDPTMPQAVLYLKNGNFVYPIPRGENLTAYAPTAFAGTRHLISAEMPLPFEIESYRDLAVNPLDLHDSEGVYPHVSANAETRGESVFAARNVVDGCRENHGHGEWPYLSWGVDIAIDAKITIDFGRMVNVSKMGICIRADFPHDSWWPRATLVLSDGTSQVFEMQKTDQLQLIDIGEHKISWARIEKWEKYEEPAEFPALIAWEVYGREV